MLRSPLNYPLLTVPAPDAQDSQRRRGVTFPLCPSLRVAIPSAENTPHLPSFSLPRLFYNIYSLIESLFPRPQVQVVLVFLL